jgi:NAD(P)-dependent dehydrogenase (short-subunit alcohol dehydrogenase family)
MNTSAQGLRVLVTAGAAGIGRAIARIFTLHGARVHICDVDQAALQACAREQPGATTWTGCSLM